MPCQEPLGPANRMAAGSVLWILAMVDGSQQAKAPGERHTPHDQCPEPFHHANSGLKTTVAAACLSGHLNLCIKIQVAQSHTYYNAP